MSNGLRQHSYTVCKICRKPSPWVSGAPDYAQRDLRKLGWRPERATVELQPYLHIDGDTRVIKSHDTKWYCPEHEQLRPSLKKNQKETTP